MRSPAFAMAWEFGRRLRLGLIALAVYALVVAVVMFVRFLLGQPVVLQASGDMAALVVVPVTTMFMFLLGVFSYGFDSDLMARESIYPARMLTLPVTTRALAGWPMFFGVSAMIVLFLTAGLFLRWEEVGGLVRFRLQPWGVDVPLTWPTLLAAVFLAWTQALMWVPYGLRGLRPIVTVLWLITLDAAVFAAVEYKVPEGRLIGFLAPQLPLAYAAAGLALARARRGDVPDWRLRPHRFSRAADALRRGRPPFSSAARAQLWYEWRLHGWALPMWVGLLLPFEVALLFAARAEPEAMTLYALLLILLTPPLMAGFVAATVSAPDRSGPDSYGLPPFIATRPLTGAQLIAAKLRATLLSTLAAWLLVLLALPLGLAGSGGLKLVTDRVDAGIEAFGMARVIAFMLLGLLGLMASTWKRLVNSLFIDLTGRDWLVKASVLLALAFLVVIWPIGERIHGDPELRLTLLDNLPWILGALVCLKISVAGWMAARLYDGRLLSERALVTGAAVWVGAVLVLDAVLEWFWATPHVASYFLLLLSILGVPLARLSAAPLAVVWNRHR